MKRLLLAVFAIASVLSASAGQSRADDEWVGLGTGTYQPGILDYYSDEYPDLMPAAVYESTTTPGVYRFVPTPPAAGVLAVYDIVVHAENPEKVWCENATYFRGFFNYNTCHKVKETSDYDIDANYGRMADGAITFATPGSFMAMTYDGYRQSNNNGTFALYLPGKSPADDPVVNDTWEVMGVGMYVEGLLDCEYKAGIAWDIEIEKSLDTPGCYRLKPYYDGNPSCPYLPEVADTYIYVHAEDEMEVYTTDFTMLNSQGKGYKVQHRAVMSDDPDYSYYGIMEDGIITFPANSHYAKIVGIEGAGRVLTNTSGKATIVLPGAKYEDYYIEAVHPACATGTGDGFCKFPFTLNAGADVATAAVVVEAGKRTLDNIDPESYLSSSSLFPNAFFGFTFNMNFPVVSDQFNTNRWTMITMALDAKNNIKNTVLTTFFTPEDDSKWEDYAKADYTDLVLGPAYMAMDETYPVLIQKKKGSKGQFRVVDPYLNHPVTGGSSYMADCAGHHHYLYVNADDPDYVYIEESPMGVNFGYGDVVASSAVGALLNEQHTIDEVKAMGTVAGRMSGDEVWFPVRSVFFFETQYKDFELQAGDEGRLLKITEYIAGIEDVTSDVDAPVEYYDMRGIRVDNPVSGQVYIKRQGSTVTKSIIK